MNIPSSRRKKKHKRKDKNHKGVRNMGKRVGKEKHTRRKGYLLYVDSAGYVAEAKMSRGRKKGR